jgi:hypothetical protein
LVQAETALTGVLRDSCLDTACRRAVLEEASMMAIGDRWVNRSKKEAEGEGVREMGCGTS